MTAAVWAESPQPPLLTILNLQASASKPNLSNIQSLPVCCVLSAEADSYELKFLAVSCYFRFLWVEAVCGYRWAQIRSSQVKAASLLHLSFPCKLWAYLLSHLNPAQQFQATNSEQLYLIFSLQLVSSFQVCSCKLFFTQLVSSLQTRWAQVRSCHLLAPSASCQLGANWQTACWDGRRCRLSSLYS